LEQAEADLVAKILSRPPGDGSFTAVRLERILESIREQSKETYRALYRMTVEDVDELAAFESSTAVETIDNAYPIEMETTKVPPAQISAAAKAQPFNGRFLRDWYRDFGDSTRKQLNAAVRLSFIEGETVTQAASRIREISGVERRHAETIARTALNHTSSVAMRETTKANAEIMSHEEWVSTLDGRTSAICRARDGKKYPIDKGPYPPAHPNCRSVRVPVTKTWDQLGLNDLDDDDLLSERPFVADTRSLKDIPKSQRDLVVGQTKAKSYNEWLRTQPREFVNDVLGKSKAKLYLDGNLSLDKFVDRNGTELTLTEIEAKHKRAWEAAGL
jgi:SPP1 gp7 family putative phage head morphogenesis protein